MILFRLPVHGWKVLSILDRIQCKRALDWDHTSTQDLIGVGVKGVDLMNDDTIVFWVLNSWFYDWRRLSYEKRCSKWADALLTFIKHTLPNAEINSIEDVRNFEFVFPEESTNFYKYHIYGKIEVTGDFIAAMWYALKGYAINEVAEFCGPELAKEIMLPCANPFIVQMRDMYDEAFKHARHEVLIKGKWTERDLSVCYELILKKRKEEMLYPSRHRFMTSLDLLSMDVL